MDFERQHFELGLIGVAAGFDNNLIGSSDIFKKEIVIDLNKMKDNIGDDGVNLNAAAQREVFNLDVKNIAIGTGLWDFGLFADMDASANLNLPKSLFVLIAEGNVNQHSMKDLITVRGSAFAGAGLRSSAQYGKLKAGLAIGVFTPLVYIPKSKLNYNLEAEDNLTVSAGGEVSVYSPFIKNGELEFGADFTMEGEYALFDFLDVGGSLENIPLGGVILENRMQLTMENINITTEGLLQGGSMDIPDTDFTETYNSKAVRVFRPLRFDTYAHYRPLVHLYPGNKLLTVTPNIGFTVDLNDEKEAFFNWGLELGLNLINLFKFHIGTGLEESVWKQRVGFVLNFRAFELNTEMTFRSSDFAKSFQGQGAGFDVGIKFGW